MEDKKPKDKKASKECGNFKKQAEEYKNSLQLLQAEFENYKKRAEKESEAFRAKAKADLISQFLPVLDSFELALKNASESEKFAKGVELIHSQFYALLEQQGLRPIDASGEFDPYRHEVIAQEESDRDGMVLEVLQKGYMLNDLVLRHSKVKVGKRREKNENNGK